MPAARLQQVSNSRSSGVTSQSDIPGRESCDESTQAEAALRAPTFTIGQSLGRSLNFQDPLLSVGEGGIELRIKLRAKPGATSVPKPTQPAGGYITWMNGRSR